jgi:hypothetical protein
MVEEVDYCLTESACTIYAVNLGLSLGGGGFAFVSNTANYDRGCYTYTHKSGYFGAAFWNGGGTNAEYSTTIANAGSPDRRRVFCPKNYKLKYTDAAIPNDLESSAMPYAIDDLQKSYCSEMID